MRVRLAAMLCASLIAGGAAPADGPTLKEMDHKSWTARDGAPQGVNALAQAADGVLWIGTAGGLFSFDGRTFNDFQPQPGEPGLPAGEVRSLLAARDGAVWVGYRHQGVARVSQGRVMVFTQADRLPLTRVEHIQQSADGTVWALSRQQNLIRFGADGAWHLDSTPLGDEGGEIHDMFIDSSDTLWLAQGERLYRRPLNQTRYFATEAQADWIFGFAETPDHRLWVNDSITDAPGHPVGRTQLVDRNGKLIARLPYTDNVFDILYAPDGSLIMLPTEEGMVRVSAQALTDPALLKKEVRDDGYAQEDGLSADDLRTLMLDADGNLWAGGQRGLDRFRPARLVPFIPKQAVSDAYLCAGPRGDVWISSAGKTSDRLYKITDKSIRSFADIGQIHSMSCVSYGDTLLLSNKGIFNVHADRITAIPAVPGTHAFNTGQVVATPDHVLFALVIGGAPDLRGIWRRAHERWTRLDGAGTLSSAPSVEYVDPQGRLWTGYGDGAIELPLGGGDRRLSSGDPGLGPVLAILGTSHGLFAGGMNGVAVRRDDRLQMLNFADRVSARGVGGLVEGANGDLWLNALRGVVHVPAGELQAALNDPQYRMKSELLTEGDFVGPIEMEAGQSIDGRDAEGRLWFATLNGVFHIDPNQPQAVARLPIVSIRSVVADQKPVVADKAIGPGVQALDIQYLGVNLSAPERVTYRYRLDGLDSAWQDAGHRTEAIYAHLPPGTYTFRVMASNDGGTWTTPVSSEPFRVLPHFYQSLWFMALCAFLALALVWFIFTLRLRFLSREIRARSEERADERIRIARDLHDTLLQGVQGLLLTVHVAAQKVARGEDSTTLLDNALSTADRIIIEGRNRVNNLRSERLSDAELVGAFEALGADFNRDGKVEFQVKREGSGAVLHAHVADEVFFIAREALTNSFRHAEASRITVGLSYGRRYFSLLCTDNGRGFAADEVDKSGHWGLRGMDERARKIGGHLRRRSDPGSGTQVLFVLASYRAYQRHSRLQFLLRAHHPAEQAPSLPGPRRHDVGKGA